MDLDKKLSKECSTKVKKANPETDQQCSEFNINKKNK